MYSAHPPRRPWRGSPGTCRWIPEKMVRIGPGRRTRASGRTVASGNAPVDQRKARVKQRRLDAHLADPWSGEWPW